jgi:hypothetical protein
MEIDGEPVMAESTFISQLKTLPVKLGPQERWPAPRFSVELDPWQLTPEWR